MLVWRREKDSIKKLSIAALFLTLGSSSLICPSPFINIFCFCHPRGLGNEG